MVAVFCVFTLFFGSWITLYTSCILLSFNTIFILLIKKRENKTQNST